MLKIGENFFIRRGKLAVKRGLFSCQVIGGSVKKITPWTKVRTLTPVRPAPSSCLRPLRSPTPVNQILGVPETDITGCVDSGETHYVGDNCPGAHREPQLRDPQGQDHTPEKPPEIDRNGPAS